MPVFQQAEGVLQFTTHGQDVIGIGEILGQQDRLRRVAAGAAQEAGLAVGDTQHGVVQPVDDIPVMQQIIIRDLVQAAGVHPGC